MPALRASALPQVLVRHHDRESAIFNCCERATRFVVAPVDHHDHFNIFDGLFASALPIARSTRVGRR